ncbi:MAG: hypothetical protein LBJ42_01560 [Holosporales bacterium]|jgi:hypothetical protein|nr:hypothetical protein [Holosporales bacterium]
MKKVFMLTAVLLAGASLVGGARADDEAAATGGPAEVTADAPAAVTDGDAGGEADGEKKEKKPLKKGSRKAGKESKEATETLNKSATDVPAPVEEAKPVEESKK